MSDGTASESITRTIASADGTRIGYEVIGSGPPLLVVHGSAADRTQWAPIKELLAETFALYLMDRRGRGLSAEEAADYSLEAEAQDILAILADIGAPAFVFGHSYGGLCTLKAAALGAGFRKILLDETPGGMPGPPQIAADIGEGMQAAGERDGRDGMLEFFLRNVVGLDDAAIEGVRGTPLWELRKNIIHTLPREARESQTYVREAQALARLEMPVRLVVGEESTDPMREAAAAIHADMPQSELVTVQGRLFTTMYSDPQTAAREIADYFMQAASS